MQRYDNVLKLATTASYHSTYHQQDEETNTEHKYEPEQSNETNS
jgi:hypothetical protein